MISLYGNQQKVNSVRVGIEMSQPVTVQKTNDMNQPPMPEKVVESDKLQQQLKEITKAIQKTNNDISLEYEKSLNMIKVLIKNGATEEVIRTIPTEAFIEMKVSVSDMIGNILDVKA